MFLSPSHLRVGIVGAGNIGQALATLLTKAGHTVKVSNSRGPDTLTEVVQRTGATAATVADAVKDANLVIVTIPQKAVVNLDKTLFSSLPVDTVVIDTHNYYPFRDEKIDEFDTESITQSRWVEQRLGHPVIKAFNNIYFHSVSKLGKPAGTPDRVALPVAGDNAIQKATVMALIDQIGFDAVDAGGLDDSWRQQPGTPVYITDLNVEGVKRALGRADRSRSNTVRNISFDKCRAAFLAGKPEDIPVTARKVAIEEYGQ